METKVTLLRAGTAVQEWKVDRESDAKEKIEKDWLGEENEAEERCIIFVARQGYEKDEDKRC